MKQKTNHSINPKSKKMNRIEILREKKVKTNKKISKYKKKPPNK